MISIPQHIIDSVKNGKTSLGDHPCFPPEQETKFIVSVIKKRFDEISSEVGDFSVPDIKRKLGKYVNDAKELERNERGALENLCKGLINELFNIPQDTLHLQYHLVDKIDTSKIRLTPESTEDFTFDDIDSIHRLTDEIYKRRILNSLIAGASAYYGNKIAETAKVVSSVNPELQLLYKKINLCNDLLLFTEKDVLPKDNKTYTDAGNVEVIINDELDMPTIKSYGLTFPVLLVESIKGLLELAIAHGLPSSQKDAQFVMKKADFKMAENWDLRLGYPLWEIILDVFNRIEMSPLEIGLNFFFMKVAEKSPAECNEFLQEVLAKTKKGERMLADIIDEIELENEQDDFDNYMSDKATEYHQLTDSVEEYNYFTPSELYDEETFMTESVEERVSAAEKEVNLHPTEAQIKAGNYKKGHVWINGFDITIENPKGSVRSGVDNKGKHWSITMNNSYGYIIGSRSVDGDEIDVFLSNNPTEGKVYVIDQVNKDGSFDEHKCMVGFNSYDEAKSAYLSNYEDGWKGLGKITEVSWDDFKKWVRSSYRKRKPFSEYVKIMKLGTTKGRRHLHESLNDVDYTDKSELIDALKREGDFLYYLPSPFSRYRVHAANSSDIQNEIFNDIYDSSYVQLSNELDDDYEVEKFCPNGEFKAYRIVGLKDYPNYFVLLTIDTD